MSAQFPLFSQVVLVQDQAKYDLKRGSVATVSQIISFEQWQKEIELIPVDIFG